MARTFPRDQLRLLRLLSINLASGQSKHREALLSCGASSISKKPGKIFRAVREREAAIACCVFVFALEILICIGQQERSRVNNSHPRQNGTERRRRRRSRYENRSAAPRMDDPGPCRAHQVGDRPALATGQRPRRNARRRVTQSSEFQLSVKLERNFCQEFSSAYPYTMGAQLLLTLALQN